ncbi:MAG: NAD(P)-binding domain-containing protein, partial [Patescibacteria group bacterium]|nr:NAD(P)-binding domain-containing protein [Patescibacteria group bacterium]
MKIAILGLGKMGSRIAQKLYEEGHKVFVWNRSKTPIEELELKIKNSPASTSEAGRAKLKITDQNFRIAENIEDLVSRLRSPRVIWLMLPAGEATQAVLDKISKYLKKGDIVIDGGNAHFRDTQKRFEEFGKIGVEFLGIGVSGGISAEKNGFPLMAGGAKAAYEYIKPILDSLAKPNGGHEYFGTGGAGHFVKMVHNGIEYGTMQSLGEGFEVLEKSKYKFDLLKVARLWQKGTLVSGFMLDRAVEVLSENPELSGIVGSIEESGEARWTIEEAKKEGVEAEI